MIKKRTGCTIAAALAALLLTTGCSEVNQQVTVVTTTAEPVVTTVEATVAEPELTERAEKLLAQNPDTVGYISIEGTQVDNPVVQYTDNDYYLSIGFDGQEFRAGTVFMDYRDVISGYPEEWSENIILYGHNMADNTMFGSLRKYRQNPTEYWEEYPFVTFSSNYADYTYVIFGLVITGGDITTTDWDYWNKEELDDKDAFDDYVENVESLNMIDNPIDVTYGDALLTLSTCYSDEDNSRFLVIARRLREDETTDELLELIQGEEEEAEE